MSFFDMLRRRKTEVVRKASSIWAALVVAVATGKADEGSALKALDEQGKTIEDLEAAVHVYQRRELVRDRMNQARKADAELVKLDREMEKAAAAFQPLLEKFEAARERYHNSHAYWSGVKRDADQARDQLIRTATDASVLSGYHAARDHETKLGQQAAALNDRHRFGSPVGASDFEALQTQQRLAQEATEVAIQKLVESEL